MAEQKTLNIKGGEQNLSHLVDKIAALKNLRPTASESDDDEDPDVITMNWKGRYHPLDRNSPALLPSTAVDGRKVDSDFRLFKSLKVSKSKENQAGSLIDKEQKALKGLFGEEITPENIKMFSIIKKYIARWKEKASHKKNSLAAEAFAKDEVQRRAIMKHKDQAITDLPVPIVWSLKEEALMVLQGVAKVYKKEFGNNHKLTIDVSKRMEKLSNDLHKPVPPS